MLVELLPRGIMADRHARRPPTEIETYSSASSLIISSLINFIDCPVPAAVVLRIGLLPCDISSAAPQIRDVNRKNTASFHSYYSVKIKRKI